MLDEINKIKIKGISFSYKPTHFHQHKNVVSYFQEALENIFHELKDEKVETSFIKTIDLKRSLGNSECIALTGGEDIYYAQRKGRSTFTKFVKQVEPQDCSSITIILNKVTANRYKIITAYIGYAAQKEPLDPAIKSEEEFNKAKEYWSTHALIDQSQKIYTHTITTECPWNNFEDRIRVRMGKYNEIAEKIKEIRENSLVENEVQKEFKENNIKKSI